MNPPSALLDLLRCELDATNHQFTHILTLRNWRHAEMAARITEVDNIDFTNAMRIIDHLVGTAQAFTLGKPEFRPGNDLVSILRAEQWCEARLLGTLERARHLHASMQVFVEAARAPRAAYGLWLEQQIALAHSESADPAKGTPALRELVAQLITAIEQTMIHAFVEWHGGREAGADAAWLASGAAMMHLTRLVNLCAGLPGVPGAGTCPAAQIQHQPGATLAADRALAHRCARTAQQAAETCEHAAIARYCSTIAKSCRAFSDWDPLQPHPDLASTPAVFHSFRATLKKFAL